MDILKLYEEDRSKFEILPDKLKNVDMINFLGSYFTTNDGERHINIEKDGKILLSISFLGMIRDIFKKMGIKFKEVGIKEYYPEPCDLFDTSKQLFLKDDQYKTITKCLLNGYRGLIQGRTGYGKSYYISYANITYKNKDAHKLVMVSSNTNSVVDVLKQRHAELGIDCDKNNIKIINPVGFMQSNLSKDSKAMDWLKKVELIQIDEDESIAGSMKAVLDLCPNKKVIYGYSASPDKIKGEILDNYDVINRIDSTAFSVISESGFSVCYFPPIKNVIVNVIKTDKFLAEEMPDWIHKLGEQGEFVKKQYFSQTNLFKNGMIFKILNKYVLPKRKAALFIPYVFKKHGDRLFSYYSKSYFKIAQWDGDKCITNVEGKKYINSEEIKNMLLNNELDIFTSSRVSYRGVDMRNILDMFLFVESQYNNVTQVLGRCSRESEDTPVNVWLIENILGNTPHYSMMHGSRIKKFKKNFKSTFNYITDTTIAKSTKDLKDAPLFNIPMASGTNEKHKVKNDIKEEFIF